jgi:hypothetical protein
MIVLINISIPGEQRLEYRMNFKWIVIDPLHLQIEDFDYTNEESITKFYQSSSECFVCQFAFWQVKAHA